MNQTAPSTVLPTAAPKRRVSATRAFARPVADRSAPAPVTDAISALVNLGYSRDIAANAISAALKSAGEQADSSRLIRLGLKELAR